MRASLKKKNAFLKGKCFLFLFIPLYFPLPVPPLPYTSVFICCAFGLNPRFPGDKAGWACRCYILLLRGFRFTYQDKDTYRFHPSFSLGTVREGDPGNCRTTVEQNYYGRVVPMKKCLAATRKPNKPWLKAEEHLNST